jgi:predicted RNase H-like HicB family nuclease
MQIPVMIEPTGEDGFRASCGWPFPVTAEGPTRDEALQRLREQIAARMTAGAEVIWLDAPASDLRQIPEPGDLKDNPLFEEWVQAMAEYRRSVDEDPNAW